MMLSVTMLAHMTFRKNATFANRKSANYFRSTVSLAPVEYLFDLFGRFPGFHQHDRPTVMVGRVLHGYGVSRPGWPLVISSETLTSSPKGPPRKGRFHEPNAGAS